MKKKKCNGRKRYEKSRDMNRGKIGIKGRGRMERNNFEKIRRNRNSS